ncbi:hypothetical protein [Paracidobacterium acidisoli]|uniref:Flagellar protein FlgJ N-terminal domain-containing protein n=1 Tax=Paracidobacterium acidisoli TaxID=2303751 RepID=A0A372ISF6_9BACT|nr:hypothetical protein [Paracidobacterium acidisoli]MBT9330315.1 hypothetical protein [Paracidobacterium acidisoli]
MEASRLTGTGAAAGAAAPYNPRLKSAAHEFEASLMKELLEPMQRHSLFSDGADGQEDGDDSQNALASFGSESMAKAISERGGFGIATEILKHFEKTGAAGKAEPSHGSVRTVSESNIRND